MMQYMYFRLLDVEHRNMIIRVDDDKEELFFHDRGWVEVGLFGIYQLPYDDNPLYDMYEELAEEEAMKAITAL